MRVAVLSPIAWRTPPRHYGPWEQVASNVAEGLTNLGLEVTLFGTGDSITAGELDAVIDTGYEEDRMQDAKVVECLHISNLMEKAGDFDIIHNHFDFLPLTYSRLIKTPMVTTIHGFSSAKIIPVYKKYNSTSSYISISNSDRSPELEYVATVYNGLRTSDFVFQNDPEDYLLFLGRIHPDKGTAEAIDIAKKSKRRLIIAGIIQDQAYFDEKVAPHLGEEIRFVGHVAPEQRNELLGNAAALLHPIRFHEPFGLSVAEAMLCGTPVVAFDKGSMAELILSGKTGYLVNTVDEAVEALPELDSISRTDCHQWAKSQFSQEKMVQDYLKAYRLIIDPLSR
ncbi:MAG TPA: glycosyltransferase family 4 protein [Cyclobacteriaceae bacterium]|nr:glycosyltransferase family 4 protein [Cyclobacteriaceae bacterium]